MIRVTYFPPDCEQRKVIDLEDGATLWDAAKALFPESDGKFPAPTIAFVGGRPAVQKLGDWDHPLRGSIVSFVQLVMGGGGGSNPLNIVVQLAVIALAVAAAAFTGGAGTFLGITGLGLGATWGAAVGGGVLLLGTMLMGSLTAQRMPEGLSGASRAEQASPTYSINSTGNQARLYQPEPEGFGNMAITPDYVANTWTQFIGNSQIGYFVYGLGRGHYRIESMKFGETVFWRDGKLLADSGYKIRELEIVEPGKAVTIFPDNVYTTDEVSGQELFAPNEGEYTGAIGPYSTNPSGTKADKLLFDFVFQTGLGYYDDEGELQSYSVSWQIDYQTIDDFGNPISAWGVLGTKTFTAKTLTPQRLTLSYTVATGRYRCRVRRTSNTRTKTGTIDTLLWYSMRAMLPGSLTYRVTCVALAVEATNTLTQGASRNFSVTATRMLPLYDRKTKTWSEEVPTRSWAAAVSHVCKCEWGGRITDANIDLDTLWAIDEKLQARGWNYDAYIDGPYLVWTLLTEMCQSQCVTPRLIGPILSFAMDAPDRSPTFALTPRNIVRNSFAVTYATWSDDTPDDVVIEYLDSAYGFQKRDVTATLPESESKEPASLSILGITNREHAHKVAVAYAAHNRWQRVMVECQVEALGRIINRGDICTVAHPRFKNTASGIVESWDEAALLISLKWDIATVSEDLFVNATYIGLTRPDGSIWGPCKILSLKENLVTLNGYDYSTLLLQGHGSPFEWMTNGRYSLPTTWTLYSSQEYQRLMVVDSITSQDLLHYNLRLLNYDKRIYQYDDLPVPPWQGRGQLPVIESLSTPQSFRAVVEDAGTVVLTWIPVSGAFWYEVEVSADNQNWESLGRVSISQMTISVSPGLVYARVRAATDLLQSGWAECSVDTTLPIPESPVVVLETPYLGGMATVSWDAISEAISYEVVLQHEGQPIYTEATKETRFAITPEIQDGGPYRNLTLIVSSIGEIGSTLGSELLLSDPAPGEVTSVDITIGSDQITLNSVNPDDSSIDKTGYILAKGESASFTPSTTTEVRIMSGLPYTWTGLSSGMHYFRIAIRDAFYEITKSPLTLNWSSVLAVEVGV